MDTALTILLAPSALVVVSALSLYQFQVLWRVFAQAAAVKSGSPVWMAVQPVLKQVAVVLENALGGTAGGVKTNLTHVLLVAVVLTILFTGERIRSALKKR